MLLFPCRSQESDFSAKPYLTQGPQNTFYFDQCIPCSPQQFLQALAPTTHPDSQSHREIIPFTSNFIQILVTRIQCKGPLRIAWISPLISNCISRASKSSVLKDVTVNGGQHSGHREEGMLSKKAASDPQHSQPNNSVVEYISLRKIGYTNASYIDLFMTK